jgi:hypothetical protein
MISREYIIYGKQNINLFSGDNRKNEETIAFSDVQNPELETIMVKTSRHAEGRVRID